MNWINGFLITAISKIEWGSVADWISGIGSLLAIIFAYWQMQVQRNKEEEDKIIANRPFFSLIEKCELKNKEEYFWITDEDAEYINIDNVLKNTTNYTYFKGDIYGYEFKNVSQALATNVVLKVEYQNKVSGRVLKTDYCNIRTCVGADEQAIMLPHSLINESKTYKNWPKRISLYFKSFNNRVYCQSWIEKHTEYGLCVEQIGIKEIPFEEMPDEGGCTRVNLPVEV